MDLIPNQTIIYMWLIFMASYWVLSRFVFKPTIPIINERYKRTEGLVHETKVLSEKVAKLQAEYATLMEETRQEARQVREEIVQAAETEAKEIIAQTRQASEKTISKAKSEIAGEVSVALVQVARMSEELASQMSDKITKKVA
jgi:F-type H+-transporting ATPase subunit b